jgi:hypothetical protein
MDTQEKAKHTPGPWKWNEKQDSIFSDNPEWKYSYIAKIATGEDIRQEHANARLIAAAPELLEACKLAAASLDAVGVNNATLRIARAAIAKAEGQNL